MKGRILNIVLVFVLATLPMAANAGWSEAEQGASLIGEARQATDQTLPAPLQVEETPAPDVDFKSSPVMFIENAGQWDDDARFQVWGGPAGTMWMAEDAIWITVVEPGETSRQVDWEASRRDKAFDPEARWPSEDDEATAPQQGVYIKLSFIGANPHPRIETFDRLDTTVSYFYGNDPEQWRPDVPVWGGVRYVDLYPRIDLEVTHEDGRMVQRLAARSGSDLAAVQLRVEGADAVAVDGDRLRLSTAAGEFTLPLLQVAGFGGEASVHLSGRRLFDVSTPFSVFSPIPSSPADDPTDLLSSTFIGGGNIDEVRAIVVEEAGNSYVTGFTYSIDFPTTSGAFNTGFSGGSTDAFAVKLNPAGSALIYATFLGGAGNESAETIAVDAAGSTYMAGVTASSDFPTTPGAFDTSFNGFCDVFVVKLNPAGSVLTYATFLGGGYYDFVLDIAVDGGGSAYVTGATYSSDFPVTPDAFDTSQNGDGDAFVAKLNLAGSALVYATFFGGSAWDEGSALAVDGTHSAYVLGSTDSSNFPTTPGAFDTSFGGYVDAFVVKLDPTGSVLTYATFLGGSGGDWGYAGIALDDTGSVYVTGETESQDFPTTLGAFNSSYNGGFADAFVVKINQTGSALVYATFLGGSGGEVGLDLAVDGTGSAYVTGVVWSTDFPTTPGAFDQSHNGGGSDGFVAKLNSAGTVLDYATFLGGSQEDYGRRIAVDGVDSVRVTGHTRSSNFPTTPGAFDQSYNGGDSDGFVAKLRIDGFQPCCDFDGDGTVDVDDIVIIASLWGQPVGPPYDQDDDGRLTIIDIQRVARWWGWAVPGSLPWIDPSVRQVSLSYFDQVYRASEGATSQWTGSHATCNAGETAPAFLEAVRLRINYFRAMAGVPAIVELSDVYSGKAQQAALMMSVNGQLSHSPPPQLAMLYGRWCAGCRQIQSLLGPLWSTSDYRLYLRSGQQQLRSRASTLDLIPPDRVDGDRRHPTH